MDIGKRIEDMGRSAALLGGWVLVASAMSIVLNVGDAIGGDGPALSRIVLGVFGLAAAGLLWSNSGKDGLYAILVWGALQIPYVATQPDGNFTKQLFDAFLGGSSQTTINGEVTDYSRIGINLVGIAVMIWAGSCRARIDLWRRRSLSPVA
jgi:uncharacterized membrane protein YuzA (DUF378 family)